MSRSVGRWAPHHWRETEKAFHPLWHTRGCLILCRVIPPPFDWEEGEIIINCLALCLLDGSLTWRLPGLFLITCHSVLVRMGRRRRFLFFLPSSSPQFLLLIPSWLFFITTTLCGDNYSMSMSSMYVLLSPYFIPLGGYKLPRIKVVGHERKEMWPHHFGQVDKEWGEGDNWSSWCCCPSRDWSESNQQNTNDLRRRGYEEKDIAALLMEWTLVSFYCPG